jgi:protein MpaA
MRRGAYQRVTLVVVLAAAFSETGCAKLSNLRRGIFRRDTTVPAAEPGGSPQDPVVDEGTADRRSSRRRAGSLRAQTARTSWQTIGSSVDGRPIEAARFGSGLTRVLLIGGIHGDEPEGLPLVERLAEQLGNDPATARHATVLVIRDLNPDGTAANTRINANGVDLNRNFPASNWTAKSRGLQYHPGPRAASEPETQLLIRLLGEFQPDRILVLHSTRGEPMVNYDGPAQGLAEAMARHNSYAVSDTIGYPTPGSLGSYAGKDLQIPIITLELPRGVAAHAAWQDNSLALWELIRL